MYSINEKKSLKFFNIDINRLLFLVSILLFVVFSVKICFLIRIPWADEVNAWNIAAYVDFFDLFKVSKVEGHLFIWYALLMPFAKNNLFYPYSMFFVNWIFAFAAVIVMWKYSPFNSLTKFFVTFSYPVMFHAVFARCYSVGIFLLFLIASIYSKRLKHPLIYSLLIILAANTSVMALAGASVLGILFIYDLLKYKNGVNINNKTLSLSLAILLLGGVMVLLQLINFSVPFYAVRGDEVTFYQNFSRFFFKKNIIYLLNSALYFLLLLGAINFFRKNYKPLVFLLLTYMFLISVFAFVYCGFNWHFSFFYIYFIISVWMYCSEIGIKTMFHKYYMILFLCFCFTLCLLPKDYKNMRGTHEYFKDYLIKNINEYKNSKLFVAPNYSYINEVFPYIEKYKLDIYNGDAVPLRTTGFFLSQWDDCNVKLDNIANRLTQEETAYLLIDQKDIDVLNLKTNKNKNLNITPYRVVYPVIIYKIRR